MDNFLIVLLEMSIKIAPFFAMAISSFISMRAASAISNKIFHKKYFYVNNKKIFVKFGEDDNAEEVTNLIVRSLSENKKYIS